MSPKKKKYPLGCNLEKLHILSCPVKSPKREQLGLGWFWAANPNPITTAQSPDSDSVTPPLPPFICKSRTPKTLQESSILLPNYQPQTLTPNPILSLSLSGSAATTMSHFGRSGPPDIADTYSLLVLNITFRKFSHLLFSGYVPLFYWFWNFCGDFMVLIDWFIILRDERWWSVSSFR